MDAAKQFRTDQMVCPKLVKWQILSSCNVEFLSIMLKFVMVSAVGLMLPAAGPSWIAGTVWTTAPLRRDLFLLTGVGGSRGR